MNIIDHYYLQDNRTRDRNASLFLHVHVRMAVSKQRLYDGTHNRIIPGITVGWKRSSAFGHDVIGSTPVGYFFFF